MFEDRTRLGPRLSRGRQGALFLAMAALWMLPALVPDPTPDWWRLVAGTPLVLFGGYALATRERPPL
jgi:hypothetical protein